MISSLFEILRLKENEREKHKVTANKKTKCHLPASNQTIFLFFVELIKSGGKSRYKWLTGIDGELNRLSFKILATLDYDRMCWIWVNLIQW